MKTTPWRKVRRKGSPEAEARIRARVDRELLEMNLADLRKALGVTQVAVAEAAEMSQSELSRIERRDDHLVSTLRRCVEAMGGTLELTAVVGGKRIRLTV
jgi:hypothetical protein